MNKSAENIFQFILSARRRAFPFKCKILLQLLLLTFSSTVASAQTDSLRAYIQSLISKNALGVISADELNDLRGYGHALENKAIQLTESNNDTITAIAALDSSIAFWVSIRESGNEAFMRRYKGVYLDVSGKHEAALSELRRSAEIYNDLKMGHGKALCYHDISCALEHTGALDSALWYQQQACDFWKQENDVTRQVMNNNQLINLYRKQKQYENGVRIQLANEKLISIHLEWKPLIDFYYVSYRLYNEMSRQEQSDAYLTLYRNWQRKLQDDGIQAVSGYE